MLSDEERMAIEHLKNYPINWLIENVNESAIKIILNLIEKKQKEIEEYKKQLDLDNECEIALNSKVMDLEKEIEELKAINKMQEYRIEVIDERELISKDKIKAKIEEWKKKYDKLRDCEVFQKAMYTFGIELLQSLLEKE